MTNKEQIRQERLAILKDALFAMLPGLVIFMIFIGVMIATGRVNAQWEEGIRARREGVNSLAVDQLKDFAVIQAGVNQLDTLPEGIDATRFKSDNQAFIEFVDEYMNWNGWEEMCEVRERAEERIGDFPLVWMSLYATLEPNSSGNTNLDKFMHTDLIGKRAIYLKLREASGDYRYRGMYQIATVQDVHAIEILKDGSYMYLAIVPAYRYVEGDSDNPAGYSKSACIGFWYSCDLNSVITPVKVEWLTRLAVD